MIGDAESPADSLVLTASSSNPDLFPESLFLLGGSGNDRTISILPADLLAGPATITLRVTDPVGASRTMSFLAAVEYFTAVTNFSYEDARVSWADSDNDGDLDLLITGYNDWSYFAPQLYRNNGDSTFSLLSDKTFMFVELACMNHVWSDLEKDGNLDLFFTGFDFEYYPASVYFHNTGSNGFAFQGWLSGLADASLAAVDFDNDGDQDVLISGRRYQSTATLLFTNNGDHFNYNQIAIPGVSKGILLCADYDNDGYKDVLVSGQTNVTIAEQCLTRIYRNDHGTNFIDILAGLPDLALGAAAWGDLDNDGDLDLALAGLNNSNRITCIYRNDAGHFTPLNASLQGVSDGALAWADVDNDGWLDLLVTGTTNDYVQGAITRLYRNLQGQAFVEISNILPGVCYSSIAFGDYDNDGDLDLILSGTMTTYQSIVRVFRNNCPDQAPALSAPFNLTSTVTDKSVSFAWDSLVDPGQPNSSVLSYNLRVGRTHGGGQVFSPGSDPVTGFHRLVALGNAGQAKTWTLNKLTPGTYFWSVQSIGNNYAASPFAAEATFVITNTPPVANDLSVTLKEDSVVYFYLSATDIDGQTLTYRVVIPPLHGTLSGIPPSLSYRPATNYFGADTFTFCALDGIDTNIGTVNLTVLPVQDTNRVFLTIRTFPSNALSISLRGEPWQPYVIQVSEDLVNWTDLLFPPASPDGSFVLTNVPLEGSQRFYRPRPAP